MPYTRGANATIVYAACVYLWALCPVMAKHTNIEEKEGVVVEAFPNTLFRVQLDDEGEVLAYLSGRMRRYRIRILVGDRVRIEMSEGDGRGRIVYRYK
jgi:translation initiation factor IF-1